VLFWGFLLSAAIKKIRTVWNDMGISEWGDERDLFVRNGHPCGTELPDDATHMDGIPHQDGVAQETQTTGLIHNLFIVSSLKRPLIGEKEAASQLMAKLTPVELALDAMAQVGILHIPEDVDRFKHTPQGGERLGEPIGGRSAREPFEHHIGRGRPWRSGRQSAPTGPTVGVNAKSPWRERRDQGPVGGQPTDFVDL
jgi:hypothetical protein